jgi:dolichol-phosphate mannosyltransferase
MDIVEVNIPAFDEFENLQLLIPQILEEVGLYDHFSFRVKVIVRNDEPQSTLDLLEGLNVEGIRRQPDNSFGSAISTGISTISKLSKFVIFMDADGSHQPSSIIKLVNQAKLSGADVVIASRYIDGGKTENSIMLKLMSKTLNKVFSLILGIGCRDVSTNFKIYKSDLIRDIELSCKNFDVVEELLLKVKIKSGTDFSFIEIPDHFQQRKFGESKRQLNVFVMSYIITLFKLRLLNSNENRNRWR